MEQRELEVMVFSANDLKNVKTFGGKMSPYCVAWIYPNMKVATPMDTNGGENPTWNSRLRLVCEESLIESGNAVVTIDIYNHGSFSNKLIGTVTIPLSDLRVGIKATDQSGSSMPPIATTYEVSSKHRKQVTILLAISFLGHVFSNQILCFKNLTN